MSTNLHQRIELQRLENEAKRLENEAKKLELELARQPGKIGFTAKEWAQLGMTAGGCFVTIPVMGLLLVVLVYPELMETYDQLIATLVAGAVMFYLGRKSASK